MDIEIIKQALVDKAHYNDSLAISAHAAVWLKELIEEVERLRIDNGGMQAALNDALGRMAGDVCGFCNWLERGDCHKEKEALRAEVERLRTALERIRRHQEIIGGSHAQHGATWNIANQALADE